MKREAFDEAARKYLNRQPFRPFVIELDDGSSLVVGQREALHEFAGAATYFGADGSITFVDAEDVKQLLELQIVSPKSAASP